MRISAPVIIHMSEMQQMTKPQAIKTKRDSLDNYLRRKTKPEISVLAGNRVIHVCCSRISGNVLSKSNTRPRNRNLATGTEVPASHVLQ